MNTFAYLLNLTDVIGPLIAVICFYLKKEKLSPELFVIRLFCIVQLVCNLTALVLDYIDIINYWLYEINNILSFLLALILFGKYLLPLKKVIVVLLIALLIACNVISYYYLGGISTFNSYGLALCSIVIVSCCLYFFYSRLINTSEEISIPDTSIFWCVVGIFTYYAGAFFIFISYKYLIDTDSSTVAVLWRFHNVLLFICCLYISYGILCKNYRAILS